MQQECSESAGEQKITLHKSSQQHVCQIHMFAKNLTLPMFFVDVCMCVCLMHLCVHYIYTICFAFSGILLAKCRQFILEHDMSAASDSGVCAVQSSECAAPLAWTDRLVVEEEL